MEKKHAKQVVPVEVCVHVFGSSQNEEECVFTAKGVRTKIEKQ